METRKYCKKDCVERGIFGNKSISLMVDATKKCQLKCSYCYFGKKAGCDMDPKNVINSLRNFTALFPNLRNMNLHFMGGEPLLAWDMIVPFVDEVRELCNLKQVHFSWGLTSNLIGLDEKKTAYMIEQKASIHCSIDGPPEFQNANRPFLDGSPSYEAVVRNVERALRVNPNDTARVTILPEGGGDCVTIASFILSLGFKHVGLFPAMGPDINWTNETIELFAKSYAEAFRNSPICEDGSRAVSGVMRGFFGSSYRKYFSHCGAGKGLWAFGVDGSIYHCHHFTNDDGRQIIGSGATTEAIKKNILSSSVSPTEKPKLISDSCRACQAFDFCNGGCWAGNLLANQDSNLPSSVACKINIALAPLIGDLIRIEDPGRGTNEKKLAGCNCVKCENCYSCDGCNNAECDACDSECQNCDTCQGQCKICERCDTCVWGCDGCQSCNTCQECHGYCVEGCDTCNTLG